MSNDQKKEVKRMSVQIPDVEVSRVENQNAPIFKGVVHDEDQIVVATVIGLDQDSGYTLDAMRDRVRIGAEAIVANAFIGPADAGGRPTFGMFPPFHEENVIEIIVRVRGPKAKALRSAPAKKKTTAKKSDETKPDPSKAGAATS